MSCMTVCIYNYALNRPASHYRSIQLNRRASRRRILLFLDVLLDAAEPASPPCCGPVKNRSIHGQLLGALFTLAYGHVARGSVS